MGFDLKITSDILPLEKGHVWRMPSLSRLFSPSPIDDAQGAFRHAAGIYVRLRTKAYLDYEKRPNSTSSPFELSCLYMTTVCGLCAHTENDLQLMTEELQFTCDKTLSS